MSSYTEKSRKLVATIEYNSTYPNADYPHRQLSGWAWLFG